MKAIAKILSLLGLFMLSRCCLAQNSNYQGYLSFDDTVRYWTEDSTIVSVIVNGDSVRLRAVANELKNIFADTTRYSIGYDFEDDKILIRADSTPIRGVSAIMQCVNTTYPNSIAFFTYGKVIDGQHILLRNEVTVKFRRGYSLTDIGYWLGKYNVDSVYQDDADEYVFFTAQESDVVGLANELYSTDMFEYAIPDYYSEWALHQSDPMFNLQYYLHNTGQVIPNGISDNERGEAGCDIKAPEAWAFLLQCMSTIGTPVKVAVIDDGVEPHEDMPNVLDGYTANGHGTGRPRDTHGHGECCAGIIAAKHNNIGIAGIAPESQIVPIRIFMKGQRPSVSGNTDVFSNRKVAKAIKKAWQDFHSEVLNLSNGIDASLNPKLRNAVQDAISNGRNGKGCIVVVSSGNEGYATRVNPYGAINGVVTVGAIDKYGIRGSYSNYSPDLDLVAFGGRLDPVVVSNEELWLADIRTTDRQGSYGYVDGNYHNYFGATSAAAPQVSGVVSLMLSVNPNLTVAEVNEILQTTAWHLPTYTFSERNNSWNNEVGYGLVDAHKAVVEALEYGRPKKIEGDTVLYSCSESAFVCPLYRPNLFSYSWRTSSNLAISSVNGNSVVITPIVTGSDSVYYGNISVDVVSQGRLIYTFTKQVRIVNDGSFLNLVPVVNRPYTLYSDKTFAGRNHLLPTAFIVDSLVTLTITGKLYCTPSARIIVRPGGKLIVNGGCITSSCEGQLWQGILCFFHGICHDKDNLFEEDAIPAIAPKKGIAAATTADGSLRIYPNPANSHLTIESESAIREATVYDLAGKIVMTGTATQGHAPAQLNISGLQSGIYLLRIATENGVEMTRFVKR